MRRKSYAAMNCSVAQALDVVGDPWTLLIVRDSLWGFRRFGDFQERLDIPRTTLADRLGRLVDAGVLTRERYQDNPERFDYVLTDKGRALRPVIVSLLSWGDRWSDLDEPPVVLVDQDSGEQIEPILVDARSGRPLHDIRVRAVPGPGAQPRTAADDRSRPPA